MSASNNKTGNNDGKPDGGAGNFVRDTFPLRLPRATGSPWNPIAIF